jgi:hypothetical protein
MIKTAGKDMQNRSHYKVGDMRKINYYIKFDKIICLWFSFNYLLTEKDQIKTLNQIYKKLKNSGMCIIELIYYPKLRGIMEEKVDGVLIKNYIHNMKSLKILAEKSKFKEYNIEILKYSHNKKLFIFLKK